NKKGAISGGANFDLGEGDGFEAATPEGQNLRIGSVKLAKNAWLDLTSGKNLTVRDITGTPFTTGAGADAITNYNRVSLDAAKRLRVRSVKDVNLTVSGENIRLSKSSTIPVLTVLTGGDFAKLSKFSIAKGTTVGELTVTTGRTLNPWSEGTVKEYNGFTASKKITQKNYSEYLKEKPGDNT
ncbi:MAG: hypothetical protein Q4D62_12550, partial [Planctomycetia bacterium]|nr:hypothetical protein [Planctomycetia bacterium]